ncbi:glycosyltransferase family 9 protein [Fluviispira multicolorata]|uniref:Heptosyltransferase-2 n=1 Tax=Fluviispira multicolorata TaxID=2654512 RepID=A0A833N0N9_9BACT|nr:glycosyltransferase family 9 protein [Fluviispira multicolorata]KAB8029106.1 hypothetical protein GCL57_11235 [Fluviispira multicolorata]
MAKYLVLKLRAMGDTVILTSVVECIKKNDMYADIDVFVESDWKAVFEKNLYVNNIYLFTRYNFKLFNFLYEKIFLVLKFLIFFRLKKYDYSINCNASNTSAFLSFLTGAKNRSNHFHSLRRKNKFSTVQIPDKGIHKSAIQRDLDTVIGFNFKIDGSEFPKIYISELEKAWAKNYLKNFLQEISSPLLMLGIGAGRRTKIWPPQYFAKLATNWIEQKKGCVVAITSYVDKELIEELLIYMSEDNKKKFLHTSSCSLRERFRILSLADIFIGNDSGLKHAAIAIGVKTYTLFGPESPLEWHPYSFEKHPIFYIENLSCRTATGRSCSIELCSKEKNKCMTDLLPDDVFKDLSI